MSGVTFNILALSRLDPAARAWLIAREREDYQAFIERELAELDPLTASDRHDCFVAALESQSARAV